jgi:hypothetical protein
MKLNKILPIIVIVIFGTLFIGVVLEKTGVTDFYSKPKVETVTPRPVNDVKYEPATTTEQEEGQRRKQELIDKYNEPEKQDSISVTLSAAGQDEPGGPVIVRALIDGTTSGTCTLTLTSSTNTVTKTATVSNAGTYYMCKGFSVPKSEVSNGSWDLKLVVETGTKTGEASQTIEVN